MFKMFNVSHLSILLLLLVSVSLAAGSFAATGGNEAQRHARSVSQSSQSSNMIADKKQMLTTKSSPKIENEKKQVLEFLTTRNIIKVISNLIFGKPEEIKSTARSVVSLLDKVLEIFKVNVQQQRGRSAGSRSTLRDYADDAATASITMIQGYVKSMLASDSQCVQRYLCEASREASQYGRKDIGSLVASVGGYAASYLLDHQNKAAMNEMYSAYTKGRSMMNEDCAAAYKCNDKDNSINKDINNIDNMIKQKENKNS